MFPLKISIFSLLLHSTCVLSAPQFIRVGIAPAASATDRSAPPPIDQGWTPNIGLGATSRRANPIVAPDYSFQARQKRNIISGQHDDPTLYSFKQWALYMNETNYDKYRIPKLEEEKPLEITVSIMIIRVHSVSDSAMDFGIEMYYREKWRDFRLAYDPGEYDGLTELNLPMAAMFYIWKPDTYFLNAITAEVDSENSVTHRGFLRLNATGNIHYSRKISLKADCPMDLSMYPFDKQYCKLKLGTYSHSSKDLVYNWARPRGHDVELKDKIVLPEFYGEPPQTARVKLNYTTGSFDSLELCIKFKRSAGFCVLQVFIPATAVVMSSWVALWMAEDTTFSDVLAVILAIIFLAYSYNSVMPRVSYVKLLDLYMCSCFLFVFLSLAKLVIIKYLCKKWAKENNRSSDWFLTQLAGISIAQQQQQDEMEKGKQEKDEARRRRSAISDISTNGPNLKKRDALPQINGPTKSLLSPPAPKKKGLRIIFDDDSSFMNEEPPKVTADSLLLGVTSPSDDMFESALEENKAGGDSSSSESDRFIIAHSDETGLDEDEFEEAKEEIVEASGERRMTFLGLEAFSAWFNEKEKKKETIMERRMRLLRWFHVVTQLALPLGFGAFFIFLMLIYPNVPDKRGCVRR